jgi:general secretion pathway protein G
MQNRKRRNSSREGMTLIEVMLVLLILMSIAAVGLLAWRNMAAEANKRQAVIALGEYARILDAYYSLYDRFPTTQEGLDALRNCPQSIDPSEYKPVLNREVRSDPWGSPYNYEYPGSRGGDDFDLWSNGPDMQSGTEDDIWYGQK